MLQRGFTSVRDLGGPVSGLKRGIDLGLVPGPRIWPSGAMISQSGGHGDFRLPNELPAPPGTFSFGERSGRRQSPTTPIRCGSGRANSWPRRLADQTDGRWGRGVQL
jgi:imidazolonepropionase-like amidohydrolase